MAHFFRFQAALVESGFDEGMWGMVKESDLLSGMLFPYGLFLRHTLKAFPSATITAMDKVKGFVVEGSDAKLVPQVYRLLLKMFDFTPAISVSQFLTAFNPCGQSRFCSHLIQTCAAFHSLMKKAERRLINEKRRREDVAAGSSPCIEYSHRTVTHAERVDGDASGSSPRCVTSRSGMVDEAGTVLEMLHVARDGLFDENHHGAGEPEELDKSELRGMSVLQSSMASAFEGNNIVSFVNRPVRAEAGGGLPLRIGGKLKMRCIDAVADPSRKPSADSSTSALALLGERTSAKYLVPASSAARSREVVPGFVHNRDRFGQFLGGDVLSGGAVQFGSCCQPEVYSAASRGEAGCAPSSYVQNVEVMDALLNNDINAEGTSSSSLGCCARHALHTIKHHNNVVDRSMLERSKLELQHAALNSQRRAPLNKEVGGFRL